MPKWCCRLARGFAVGCAHAALMFAFVPPTSAAVSISQLVQQKLGSGGSSMQCGLCHPLEQTR